MTPVTLVTGFLAAGKTTAIRHWCARRPAGERWAVLVNDFGHLAIDAAAHADVAVFEVPGGCACCAASVAMRTTLGRILRRGPWDRLVIELSGLGHPAAMIDLLRDAGRSMPLRLDGVVAFVDGSRPGPWLDAGAPYRELARAQVDAADLVVLNRSQARPPGGAPPSPLLSGVEESGDGPAASLARARLVDSLGDGPFGPRPVLACGDEPVCWDEVVAALRRVEAAVHGMAAASLPAAHSAPGKSPDQPALSAPLQAAGRAASHPDEARVASLPDPGQARAASAPTGGTIPIGVALGGRRWTVRAGDGFGVAWQWPAETVFDRRALLRWAERVGVLPGLLRAKGVFRTQRDWYFWQHAPGGDTWEQSGWRRDSRVECLFADPFDPVGLERGLLDALDGDAGTGRT